MFKSTNVTNIEDKLAVIRLASNQHDRCSIPILKDGHNIVDHVLHGTSKANTSHRKKLARDSMKGLGWRYIIHSLMVKRII